MRTLLLLAALLAFPAHAQHKHADLKPQHGGLVEEASDVTFELVARPDSIAIHVSDHGKPVSTSGATARVDLRAGKDKQEAALAPAGENRLEAKGAYKLAPGTRVIATVTLAGRKAIKARFTLR